MTPLEEWRADAACRDKPTRWWFPLPTEDASRARAICADCPVIESCRLFALANNVDHGIYGGLDEKQRQRIRKSSRLCRGGCGDQRSATPGSWYCPTCRDAIRAAQVRNQTRTG